MGSKYDVSVCKIISIFLLPHLTCNRYYLAASLIYSVYIGHQFNIRRVQYLAQCDNMFQMQFIHSFLKLSVIFLTITSVSGLISVESWDCLINNGLETICEEVIFT
jgi:hypothetical protein